MVAAPRLSHEYPLLPTNDRRHNALVGHKDGKASALHGHSPGKLRDYADVPPTRGVFRGKAESELAITVRIVPSKMTLTNEFPLEPPAWMPSASEVDERDQLQQHIFPQQQ